MEKKYNYTYQIKNLINGKTYIGVHSTDDLDDGYMGSGYRLKQSMEKHGKENFVKTIMCFFDTANEAYEEEAFLVDEKWIKRRDNYNVCIGGLTGPIYYGDEHWLRKKGYSDEQLKNYRSDEFRNKMSKITSGKNNGMYGKKHKEETKRKISQRKNTNLGKGNKRKSDNLPPNIRKIKYSTCIRFQVRVKSSHVGNYPTLEEAVIAKDNYLEKNV